MKSYECCWVSAYYIFLSFSTKQFDYLIESYCTR